MTTERYRLRHHFTGHGGFAALFHHLLNTLPGYYQMLIRERRVQLSPSPVNLYLYRARVQRLREYRLKAAR